MTFEGRPAGGGAFSLIATDNVAPYEGFWNASSLSGLHELRATATDSAGNPATSVSVLVTVDSTAPSVTLGDLGSLVRGVVTLAASTQGAAVTQVVFKRKLRQRLVDGARDRHRRPLERCLRHKCGLRRDLRPPC